ncbi:MAG: AbrB/MazE/SpoVT family DNA-binding domain-containing protein [Alphaproteobacteria bacterium]|nr:AbrB/MazE/SpoVT family DNA-binding domain-containing protein [Alphaproteobacteria bacterium]MCB9700127.1 AbrB/MazE/SpoVT family DNA-binding domain-containing protein [Alphaproteobacteria bacterium]
MSTRTARLFQSGGSQAVRLPAEFRFSGDVVYVRRDERTGDVILSASPPGRWADVVEARERLGGAPDDFLVDREQPVETRDPFEDS